MKKSWKQWMAITCALAMIVSLLPVTILAEEGVATPTDLAPVVEPVQEAALSEEEKVTYTARIAAAQRDGKIYLTVVVEPEYTGTVIWEKKTQDADGEKWVVIDTTSTTLMILPGSDLIGKEIRFRLEDGTTPVLNYVVPELEPVEEPAEGNDKPVVEINQEKSIKENETEPAAEQPAEEPAEELTEENETETESIPEAVAEVPTEEQEIEDYETPLGLDDVIATEPETQEEPAEEPEEETEATDDDLEIEIIEETLVQDEAPVVMKAEEASEAAESEEMIKGFDVREEADGMSAIFTTLPLDAEIAVLGIEGDWVKVDVDGQIGYIYKADLKEIIDLPEEDSDITASEKKVLIFTSRRTQMSEGEPVYLTSKLVGLEGYEIEYQWECDKHDGAGFRDVEGANSETYSFNATVETLSWDWRLSVFY